MLTIIDLDRPEEAKKAARKLYESGALKDATDAAYELKDEELFGKLLGKYSQDKIFDLRQSGNFKDMAPLINRHLKDMAPLINRHLKEKGIGETIVFGNYGGVPIRWTVLDIIDGKKLLISEEALDCRRYNDTFTAVTWETCTLRKWLNSDFLNEAFSPRERERIAETVIQNPDNPKYKTKGGNDTKDKVFLLSIREARKYFEDDNDRVCRASGRAKKDGACTDSHGSCWWWLRSPGDIQGSAAHVDNYGYVYSDGGVYGGYNAVRPAFFLNP